MRCLWHRMERVGVEAINMSSLCDEEVWPPNFEGHTDCSVELRIKRYLIAKICIDARGIIYL